MQLKALLQEGRKRLISSGCESARLDADLLLMHALNCPRSFLITHDNDIAQMADRIVQIEDGRILIGSDLNAKE